jgi:hypothetical protein
MLRVVGSEATELSTRDGAEDKGQKVKGNET